MDILSSDGVNLNKLIRYMLLLICSFANVQRSDLYKSLDVIITL
jgi:hypothetical protein